MKRSLPPLNALRAFEVAARTGGFTRASHELLVSQGAVSRHVASLETFLGVKLFRRSHRMVRLTQEGEAYAAAVRTALDHIEQATQQLRRGQAARPLHIKLYSTLAIRWLVPRLGRFRARYPGIDVKVTSDPTPAQMGREDVEFTIDHGNGRQEWLRHDPLFRIELLPVCSRSLIESAKCMAEPRDLLDHLLLHSLNRPKDWARWLEHFNVTTGAMAPGLTFSNSSLAYEAAINGIGIAMAQAHYVEDELEAGRLVAPFPQRLCIGRKYYLVSRNADADVPEVAAFRDWMLAEARQSSAFFEEDEQPPF
jgi:LysR family glycine cleavage system transcriptional activator